MKIGLPYGATIALAPQAVTIGSVIGRRTLPPA
jgi:hypothetical protein